MDTNTFTQEEKWLYKRLELPLYQFTAIFPSLPPAWQVPGQAGMPCPEPDRV